MHPPIRSWNLSVESVDTLRKQLMEFRRQWAQFAARSGHLFQAFREKGADFPDEFLDRLCDLQNRKADLHAHLKRETAAVPADKWQLSPESASLHTLEQDIDRLRQACRQQEQQFRDWRSGIAEPLQLLGKVTADSAAVRSLLSPVQSSVRQVLTQLEDVDSLDCDQAETWCEVVDALVHLMADQDPPAEDEAHQASLEECERWFDAIEQAAGRSLALAAVRGELQLDSDLMQQHLEGTQEPPGHSVTADAVEELQQKLQLQNERIAEPRAAVLAAPEPVRTMVSCSDAEGELRPLIGGLRQLRDHLVKTEEISTSNSDHPLFNTALGLGNLIVISEQLLEVLAARDRGSRDYRAEVVQAVNLLAEAQSAVREQTRKCQHGPGFVPQQDAIFHWLKDFVSEDREQIRVHRFMRLDAGANPANCRDLASRIRSFRTQLHQRMEEQSLRERLELSVSHFKQQPDAGPARLLNAVEELLSAGTTVTSAWLRDLLLDVADLLPDHDDTEAPLSDPLRSVLKNLEDFRVHQVQQQSSEQESSDSLSPEVRQVRQWLRGKTVALVAGEARPEHRRRIENDFQLKSLVWISAGKKDRIDNLAPQLKGASLMILVTGLMGHKHSDLRQHADARNIPFVQTKQNQGYGSSTLAAVIIDQASKRFRQAG